MDKNNLKIPVHIAMILDGNRRWAKKRGKPAFFGHKMGVEMAKKTVNHALKRGVKIITLWGFSTENWDRDPKEVSFLMHLFESFLKSKIKEFTKKGVRFRHIGDPKRLPTSLQKEILHATEVTKNNDKLILNLALNYGGRDEIRRMVIKIVKGGFKPQDITVDLINKHLDTAGLPDPDLIVRTSGEQRLSGFLSWQGAYSELYFPKIHWPDFDDKEFDKAIVELNKRDRRFGK